MSSLVSRSLSLSLSGALGCGFKHKQQQQLQQHRRGFQSLRLRAVNVVRSEQGEPVYPSPVLEIGSEVELNEVAPPLSDSFGTPSSAGKEVSIMEDPAGFFRSRWEAKVRNVEQALQSVGERIGPSPYSPAQGEGIVGFILVSACLGLLFWVGNYLVPTWIFQGTVFKDNKGNVDDDDVPGKVMEDEVDPAELIDLPTNLEPFRGIAVEGFKAGRQKAREQAEGRRRKRSGKRK